MSKKCSCGADIAPGRQSLGFSTCLACGDKEAQQEITAKKGRVAVAYNKGGLQYMGDAEVAARNLRGTMGAQGRNQVTPNEDGVRLVPVKVQALPKPKVRRKQIGIAWIDGQPYAIFDRNDPRLAKASRHCFF